MALELDGPWAALLEASKGGLANPETQQRINKIANDSAMPEMVRIAAAGMLPKREETTSEPT